MNNFTIKINYLNDKVEQLASIAAYLSDYFHNPKYRKEIKRVKALFDDKVNKLIKAKLPVVTQMDKIQNTEYIIDDALEQYKIKKDSLDKVTKLFKEAEKKFGLSIKSKPKWKLFKSLYLSCRSAIQFDNNFLFNVCYEKLNSVYEMINLNYEIFMNDKKEEAKDILSSAESIINDDQQHLLYPEDTQDLKNIIKKYRSALRSHKRLKLLPTAYDKNQIKNIVSNFSQTKYQLDIIKKINQCLLHIHGENTLFKINDNVISNWVGNGAVGENFKLIMNTI